MDYADMLCNRAGEWYGWNIKFAGDFVDDPFIEVNPWVNAVEDLPIGIGREHQPQRERTLYGFVGRSQLGVLLFHPFAGVYSGEEYDCRPSLVSAAFLYLRKKVLSRPAHITFPETLAEAVNQHHLDLLHPDNLEVKNFQGEMIRHIIKPMTLERTLIMLREHLDSLR